MFLTFTFSLALRFFPHVSQWPVFSPKLFCNPYPSRCRTIPLIHRLVNALNSHNINACLKSFFHIHWVLNHAQNSLSKTASTGHCRCPSSFVQSTTAPRTRSLVTGDTSSLPDLLIPFSLRSQPPLWLDSPIAVSGLSLSHCGGWDSSPPRWLAWDPATAVASLTHRGGWDSTPSENQE